MAPLQNLPSPSIAKSKKKRKKAKDPNKPKKNLSAFFYFAQARRQSVRDANPSMKMTEVAKELGVLWHAADAATKAPFEASAQKDAQRYADAMKHYLPPDAHRIKRPKSAYLFFCVDRRASVLKTQPSLDAKQILGALGSMWSTLSDAERLPYAKQAAAAKAEYTKRVAEQAAKTTTVLV